MTADFLDHDNTPTVELMRDATNGPEVEIEAKKAEGQVKKKKKACVSSGKRSPPNAKYAEWLARNQAAESNIEGGCLDGF